MISQRMLLKIDCRKIAVAEGPDVVVEADEVLADLVEEARAGSVSTTG